MQACPNKDKSGRAEADILFNKHFFDFGFSKCMIQYQGIVFENKIFNN